MLSNIEIHARLLVLDRELADKRAERQARLDEASRGHRPIAAKRFVRNKPLPIGRLAMAVRPLRMIFRPSQS